VRPKLSFLFTKLDFWPRREEVENPVAKGADKQPHNGTARKGREIRVKRVS